MEQLQKVKAILLRRARDYRLKFIASGFKPEYQLLEQAYRTAALDVDNQMEEARAQEAYIFPPTNV